MGSPVPFRCFQLTIMVCVYCRKGTIVAPSGNCLSRVIWREPKAIFFVRRCARGLCPAFIRRLRMSRKISEALEQPCRCSKELVMIHTSITRCMILDRHIWTMLCTIQQCRSGIELWVFPRKIRNFWLMPTWFSVQPIMPWEITARHRKVYGDFWKQERPDIRILSIWRYRW